MKACPQCHVRYPAEAMACFVDGTALVEIHDPRIGMTIAGRYAIESILGEGGTAVVYRAQHKLVDRPCAIKVLRAALASDPLVRERIQREVRSAQSLSHPNIVEIFDHGELGDGTPYLVMELLDGTTLAQQIARDALPLPRAVPLMIQIARGVARAHDLGVIHRDLKPANFVTCERADGTELLKILDFGLARSLGDPRLTHADQISGTPPYLAPERIRGGEGEPAADLYALGVIFFEMTTGKPPFTAPDPAQLLVMHLTQAPPRLGDHALRVPEKLDRLVAQLLEKDPQARPVDAHRVEQDLVELAYALHLPLPPQPEDDPASTLPPSKPLPATVVDQWLARIEVFDRMLARVAGGSDVLPTRALAPLLDELREQVGEMADLHHAAAIAQRTLEDVDTTGREGRQRFGVAVDALGLDVSKARDRARAARAELPERVAATLRASEAYALAQSEMITWEGRSARQEPYPQLAEAYRRCAETVDCWWAARSVERAAHAAIEKRDDTVADLDYQLAALRAGLASHERRVDEDRAATQRQLVDLNARVERVEAHLTLLAAHFCESLRGKPELAPQFEELEAAAAVATLS